MSEIHSNSISIGTIAFYTKKDIMPGLGHMNDELNCTVY